MSRIAAIFDLDRTLITRSSGTLFAKYMRQSGQLWDYWSRRQVASTVAEMVAYQLGFIDTLDAMRRLARLADGIELDEMWCLANHWFEDYLIHAISSHARERLDWHRAQKHIPVICSASNQFAVVNVAKHLQIDHYAYSEWLAKEGKLTGYIREPILYGNAKLEWMNRWADTHAVDLSRCYFYSDDASDMPLLEVVAHAAAVNPHRSLRKIAQQRGWPIMEWQ